MQSLRFLPILFVLMFSSLFATGCNSETVSVPPSTASPSTTSGQTTPPEAKPEPAKAPVAPEKPKKVPMTVEELLKVRIRMRVGDDQYYGLKVESKDGLSYKAILTKITDLGKPTESEVIHETSDVYIDAKKTHYTNACFFDTTDGTLRIGFGDDGAYATNWFSRGWILLHQDFDWLTMISGQYFDWVYRKGGEIKTPALVKISRVDSSDQRPGPIGQALQAISKKELVFAYGETKRTVSFEWIDEFGLKAVMREVTKEGETRVVHSGSVFMKSESENNAASNGTYFDSETGKIKLGFGPYGAYATHWFSEEWIDLSQARGSFTWVSGVFYDWVYASGKELQWQANYRVDTVTNCDRNLDKP